MDTDSFILHIQIEDFYKDIANDVNNWFDTSRCSKDDDRLPIGINKKVLGKFKDELNGLIMTEFVALRSKVYAFEIDGFNIDDYDKNNIINKKAKGTKKCVIKKMLVVENYKRSLFNNETILRLQQRFASDHHKMNTANNNKIALSSNDDKRLHTFDRITTYPLGTNAFMIRKSEMLMKRGDIPIKMYY